MSFLDGRDDDAVPAAPALHEGGPSADKQIDGANLYAVGPDGSPLHDKHSIRRLHDQAVKDGRTSDAHALHRHLERRFGGGDFHAGSQSSDGY